MFDVGVFLFGQLFDLLFRDNGHREGDKLLIEDGYLYNQFIFEFYEEVIEKEGYYLLPWHKLNIFIRYSEGKNTEEAGFPPRYIQFDDIGCFHDQFPIIIRKPLGQSLVQHTFILLSNETILFTPPSMHKDKHRNDSSHANGEGMVPYVLIYELLKQHRYYNISF